MSIVCCVDGGGVVQQNLHYVCYINDWKNHVFITTVYS